MHGEVYGYCNNDRQMRGERTVRSKTYVENNDCCMVIEPYCYSRKTCYFNILLKFKTYIVIVKHCQTAHCVSPKA